MRDLLSVAILLRSLLTHWGLCLPYRIALRGLGPGHARADLSHICRECWLGGCLVLGPGEAGVET